MGWPVAKHQGRNNAHFEKAWFCNRGGTEDWRQVLKEATSQVISTRAIMAYFKPLMNWREEQNKGRQIGWTNRDVTV